MSTLSGVKDSFLEILEGDPVLRYSMFKYGGRIVSITVQTIDRGR
jgi:hypothetical protein